MLAVRIGQYPQNPDPFFVERGCNAVNISDEALKSVAFIGIKKDGRFLPRATAFFVSYLDGQHRFTHLVTAEHVISGLLLKNHDLWLRVNLVDGTAGEVRLEAKDFRFHPDNEREPTDVAVCPILPRIPNEETGDAVDMDVAPMLLDGPGGFIPTAEFAKQYMGRGGNISIIGLFRSHSGANRNKPIVRFGNISMLPDEPVWTSYAGYIKAYLVEVRSIAGLSGSPVFAHADPVMELSKALAKQKRVGQYFALLGLVHGHFDVPNMNEDVVTDEQTPAHSVNTGIGIVIPVEKIIETINHPELVAMRKKIIEELRKSGATPDLAIDGGSSDAPPPKASVRTN